ncbi:uncharacterized protein ACA1_155240 [Acanthamoeba castellanii str. Neff]|jgi:hypothetical protein|uniref:Uncharacterized protein n=1 Tax=Acanthamoeba castellanii (strain ATCC 30010 / Neff) TaxID=1257118 RepID=L8H1F6_ACACF|nr:uncharacterized protein ACA1_155240 [Acanthamoeba castellanii str. Neff]ELR18578.1 hypothetical protein ACA1_155240 [Acanthamoeba castellanii str. Neff]
MKALAVLMCIGLLAVATHGMGHIPTPFGMMPETCVHRVRSGATIREVEGGVHVAHPEGDVHLPTRPECVAWLKERMAATEARLSQSSQPAGSDVPTETFPPSNGWLDYVGYYPSQLVHYFSGRYTVPQTPKNMGGLLYWFIGSENFQTGIGVTILQPVLTYYTNGWTFSSWNCCPQGQAHQSTPISGFGPGDVLDGVIDQSGDNWVVYSSFGRQSTQLTVPDAGRKFNWVDVTLETYDVTDCAQFASGPVSFYDMKLVLSDGSSVPPVWQLNSPASTKCNGTLTVNSPFSVTIRHN